MTWLVNEERKILLKVECAVEKNEVIHPNQVKIWRSEMRVPAMYQSIKLETEEIEDVERRQHEQAEYYKNRALKKIEEGSEYSSDFESIDESDYVTTDGEGVQETYTASNIKVIRGLSIKNSRRQS